MDKKLGTKIAAAGAGLIAVAGIAIASPSLAATHTTSLSSSSTPAPTGAPSFGGGQGDNDGDGPRGGHGHGGPGGFNVNATPQTVTVNVPNDGKTYMLVVTEAAPANAPTTTNGKTLPAFGAHSEAIAITGTGAQTVTVPPVHPGSFTLKLVAVTGSAVTGTIGIDGKLTAPITVG